MSKSGTDILLGFLREAETRVGNAHYVIGKITYILNENMRFSKHELISELVEIKRVLELKTDVLRE